MVNYENSVIYKLCCTDPTVQDVYVGSTTNVRKRKNQHKECVNTTCVTDILTWNFGVIDCMDYDNCIGVADGSGLCVCYQNRTVYARAK